MPYSEKLSSMTLFSSMIYRVSHAIPVGMLLDIWLGIVKQGGKRMHHYLLSMMKLLEKYYNINYYCTYKLLFILCWRILNPLYWLSLLKWDNRYIKWLVSIGKKTEEAGMDKGIYLPYSSRALITPFIIICWIFSLACLVCSKILSVQLVRIILENDIIFYPLLVVFVICGYYVNEIFLFKNDKYEKYFAEFDKKKKYLLYYSIYVVSLIVQFATFYLLLIEIVV